MVCWRCAGSAKVSVNVKATESLEKESEEEDALQSVRKCAFGKWNGWRCTRAGIEMHIYPIYTAMKLLNRLLRYIRLTLCVCAFTCPRVAWHPLLDSQPSHYIYKGNCSASYNNEKGPTLNMYRTQSEWTGPTFMCGIKKKKQVDFTY